MVEDAADAAGLDDARRLALAALRARPPRRRRAARSGGSPCPRRVALFRINALDAAIKGAIEHGVGHDAPAPDGR